MIEMQKIFLKYEEQLQTELNKIPELAQHVAGFEKLAPDNLKRAMRDQMLFIPVVGAFNAGKTSLINSFMQQPNKLPVNLDPETSLATEIYYGENECVEAVKANGSIDEYTIEELDTIKSRAEDYRFMRVYCNSEPIRDIQPLVLVDMPGFESPLDLHNKAILEYISRGCHYVVLSSVKEEIITPSMLRHLHDIHSLERRFSFVLSKVNLEAPEEVNEISKHVKETLHDEFDWFFQIVQIDKNGGENLHKILTSIDPEQLFKELYIASLRQQYEEIVVTIKTSLVARRRQKEDNDTTVAELKRGQDKISKHKERVLKDIRKQHKGITDNIIQAVGGALEGAIERLISNASNPKVLELQIGVIIRKTLISATTKEQMGTVINDIINNFTEQLSSLNLDMKDFSIDKIPWDEAFKALVQGILDISKQDSGSNSSNQVESILRIIDVAGQIIYLKKQKKQLRDNFQDILIPDITFQLRPIVEKLIDQQIQDITSQIGGSFEKKLKQQEMFIEKVEEKRKSENTEEAIKMYEDVQQVITTLANTTIYE